MVDNNDGPVEEKEKYASRSDIEAKKAEPGQLVAVSFGKDKYFPAAITDLEYDTKTGALIKIRAMYLEGPRQYKTEALQLGWISSKPAEKLEKILTEKPEAKPKEQPQVYQQPQQQVQPQQPQYQQQPQPPQPIVIYAQPPQPQDSKAQQQKGEKEAKPDPEKSAEDLEKLIEKIENGAERMYPYDDSAAYLYKGKMYLIQTSGGAEEITSAHPRYQEIKDDFAEQIKAEQNYTPSQQPSVSVEQVTDIHAPYPPYRQPLAYVQAPPRIVPPKSADADEEDKIDFNAPPYSNIIPPPYPGYVPPQLRQSMKPAAKNDEEDDE